MSDRTFNILLWSGVMGFLVFVGVAFVCTVAIDRECKSMGYREGDSAVFYFGAYCSTRIDQTDYVVTLDEARRRGPLEITP